MAGYMKSFLVLMLALVLPSMSIQAATPTEAEYAQRLCANLETEATRVTNDQGDLRAYLSPMIAQDLYDRLVTSTAAQLATDSLKVPPAPAMSQLPCTDTVERFMMAIKGRMELGMARYTIANARPYLIGFVLVLLLVFGRRLHRWWVPKPRE